MIPHRVKLSGFLSYTDEQDIRFGGAAVWMLAGTNGSGKSSVFDAVTYALFGHHRGGSQNAAELINKDSSALAVEFDFKLDGRLFRAKRTLRRSQKGAISGTQQMFALPKGVADDSDAWDAVADTTKKVDFDKWVHEHVGLDYETFTSSVLLLQGKAEKLLDSKPSGRAEVLAGIVDLGRYQRLHEKANAKKLGLKGQLDTLAAQIEGVPEVSDMEYVGAALRIGECEHGRVDVQKRIDDLSGLELQARRWEDADARHRQAEGKLKTAESLLTDAVRIEARFNKLTELRAVVPVIGTVAGALQDLRTSKGRVKELERRRDEAKVAQADADREQEKSKRQVVQHKQTLTADEKKLADGNARLRVLAVVLNTLKMVATAEADVRRLTDDAAALPANPDAEVAAAQAAVDRLTDLARVLPILERVNTERHDLAQALRKAQDGQTQLGELKAKGKAKATEQTTLTPEQAAAKEAKTAADEQLGKAKSLVEQAAAALAEFDTHAGEKTCRSCGSPLTAKHFADEKAKRADALRRAEGAQKDAISAGKMATEKDRDLTARLAKLATEVADLRELYTAKNGELKQADADAKRLRDSLTLRYAELPDPYKSRIAPSQPADWSATHYPERDELAVLRRDVEQLDTTRRVLRTATDTQAKARDLRTRLDTATTQLTALRATLPPGDSMTLRAEHATLTAAEKTLIETIQALKKAIETAEREADKRGRDAHDAAHTQTEIAGKLTTEEVTRKHCTDTIERALRGLTDKWRTTAENAGMGEYAAFKGELDTLIADGVEAKAKQLEQARLSLAALREDIERLSAEAAEFPPEAKRSPADIRTEVVAARKEYEDRDRDLREAQKHRDKLDGHRERRATLGADAIRLDGEHNRYKLLSELLGRDRLQRHLVRQAERQIVDFANAVLDRLSGGQLFLKLVGGSDGAGTDRALDMECANRVTGGAPINVTFLSGSQRFRVAVSLALAIGQYASRLHRPIESVIIDEGFGCLDRQGRQVMIQELQNLRGHLNCILLVSHQEEFADAFADGYRFELQNGATRVSRFQR